MTNIVNYCKNPSFEVNVTDDWNAVNQGGVGGTFTRDTTYYKVGAASSKLHASSGGWCSALGIAGVSVPNGTTVSLSCWARCSADPAGTVSANIYDTTTPATRATASATAASNGAWEYLTTSWLNNTGIAKTCAVNLGNNFNDSVGNVWFDACQLELAASASAYTDGAQGESHSWAGDAHNSVSTWTEPPARPSASVGPYMLV